MWLFEEKNKTMLRTASGGSQTACPTEEGDVEVLETIADSQRQEQFLYLQLQLRSKSDRAHAAKAYGSCQGQAAVRPQRPGTTPHHSYSAKPWASTDDMVLAECEPLLPSSRRSTSATAYDENRPNKLGLQAGKEATSPWSSSTPTRTSPARRRGCESSEELASTSCTSSRSHSHRTPATDESRESPGTTRPSVKVNMEQQGTRTAEAEKKLRLQANRIRNATTSSPKANAKEHLDLLRSRSPSGCSPSSHSDSCSTSRSSGPISSRSSSSRSETSEGSSSRSSSSSSYSDREDSSTPDRRDDSRRVFQDGGTRRRTAGDEHVYDQQHITANNSTPTRAIDEVAALLDFEENVFLDQPSLSLAPRATRSRRDDKTTAKHKRRRRRGRTRSRSSLSASSIRSPASASPSPPATSPRLSAPFASLSSGNSTARLVPPALVGSSPSSAPNTSTPLAKNLKRPPKKRVFLFSALLLVLSVILAVTFNIESIPPSIIGENYRPSWASASGLSGHPLSSHKNTKWKLDVGSWGNDAGGQRAPAHPQNAALNAVSSSTPTAAAVDKVDEKQEQSSKARVSRRSFFQQTKSIKSSEHQHHDQPSDDKNGDGPAPVEVQEVPRLGLRATAWHLPPPHPHLQAGVGDVVEVDAELLAFGGDHADALEIGGAGEGGAGSSDGRATVPRGARGRGRAGASEADSETETDTEAPASSDEEDPDLSTLDRERFAAWWVARSVLVNAKEEEEARLEEILNDPAFRWMGPAER